MIDEIGRKNIPIQMNLSFFDGDKTEKATPKKREKSREEGQVAQSQEIGTAFLFISVFTALRTFAPSMIQQMGEVFRFNFNYIEMADQIYNATFISKFVTHMFLQVMLIVMPIFLIAMVVGIIVNLAQVGWKPTTKTLKPKFSKLNPMKGLKRLFSVKVLVDLVKALLKFTVIVYTIYNILQKEVNVLGLFFEMDLVQSAAYIGNICVDVGVNVGMLYLLIAALDFAYTKFKHEKDLRMSKQDIKEEYKQAEGDPQMKGKIKQRMREASMRRMMQDVPTADVIITNPTHFAVALKYDKDKGEAPILVAKGMDHLALKIKSVAKENDIVIVENKPLARTLYSAVDIGREIPPELYQTVAEILAYVYKIKNIA